MREVWLTLHRSDRDSFLDIVNSCFEIYRIDLKELGNDDIKGSTGEISYRDLRPWSCCGGLLSPEEEMKWHEYHIKNCLTYLGEMRDFVEQLTDLIKRKGKQLNEKKKQAIKRIEAKDITGTCLNWMKHVVPISECTNSKQLAKKEQKISEEIEQLSRQAQANEAERKKSEEKNERERENVEKENERLRKEQEEKQEELQKIFSDRSSSYEKILTAFNTTSPTVFFNDLDPSLWQSYGNWGEKVLNMPITIPKGKSESEELKQFKAEMIKAIKEAETALKIREENEKRQEKDQLNQAKTVVFEFIEQQMSIKGLKIQDLGPYSNYQEQLNNLDKVYKIRDLEGKILDHIFALPKPNPDNPPPSPNPNPEQPNPPKPNEPQEQPKLEEEKIAEVLNGFRTHKYDDLSQQELIKEIEKEKLNNSSLQKLVSQLEIKVQELQEEIRELKAETPQTKEIKDEIHKRETQLKQAQITISSISNNNNNNNEKPWPIIPIIGTISLIALCGLIVYKIRKNRVRR